MSDRQYNGAQGAVAELLRPARQPVRGGVQRVRDESEGLPRAQHRRHELLQLHRHLHGGGGRTRVNTPHPLHARRISSQTTLLAAGQDIRDSFARVLDLQ